METPFTRQAGVQHPIICGAMYPCSNPELVAAAAKAGIMAIVQPISLTFVHKHEYREGIRWIKSQTQNPFGLNLLIEKGSDKYLTRNREWLDIALEEGVRFFITALGNPSWVAEKVHAKGGVLYHDVTERKWAEKALAAGVDGLICVNNRAGGHAGHLSPEELMTQLKDLGKPLICAGGIGSHKEYKAAMDLGYAGVQLGTRFIATKECNAHEDYKKAIVKAKEEDIVLTKKLTGVNVAIINTPYVQKTGTEPGPILSRLLNHPRTKHLARMYYAVQSLFQLRRSVKEGSAYKDYFQAGKSVETIDEVESVADVVKELTGSSAPPAS